MLPIPLLQVLIVLTAVSTAVAATIQILYGCFSHKTQATIIEIEAKQKYVGSSPQKHTAYDYVYEYHDKNGKKHRGKILRNSPEKEFSKGDVVDIKYLKIRKGCSRHVHSSRYMASLPFVTLVMLIVLLFLYHLSTKT